MGKTTLASKFKNVLIAGFEQGTNALHNVYVAPIKTWSEWKSYIKQLCSKKELKERFESIAVDTVDQAWELCTKWVCAQNNVEELRDLPYGQGYDLAKKEFHGTFRELSYNGYGIVFISHSEEKTYKDDNSAEYTKIVPALNKRPFDVVNKMVDIIAYIREIPVQIGDEIERKRYMFLRGDDRFLAKSRWAHITPKIELSYESLVQAIYDAIDAEIADKGGEASNNDNPYTKRTFEEAMDEARILWGKVINDGELEEAQKILQNVFGKPTKFSEILPEQINELNIALEQIKTLL